MDQVSWNNPQDNDKERIKRLTLELRSTDHRCGPLTPPSFRCERCHKLRRDLREAKERYTKALWVDSRIKEES